MQIKLRSSVTLNLAEFFINKLKTIFNMEELNKCLQLLLSAIENVTATGSAKIVIVGNSK